MRIGIMGGTFFPIHNGHLKMAEAALVQYSLDKIWFMPNKIPPHKSNPRIEEMTKHRVAMVELAIEKHASFEYQPYEIEKDDISYSYQTLLYFKNRYPEDEFFFIIGADSLYTFDTWRCPDVIAKLCTLVVACRDQKGPKEMRRQAEYLTEIYNANICFLDMPFANVSSTEIRNALYENKYLQSMLPGRVFAYIVEQELFYPQMIKDFMRQLKEVLDENRYLHSLGVMKTAALLAKRYEQDVIRIMTAGLLHDCAKCIPGREKIWLCEKVNIPMTAIEKRNPGLLHAKLGAYLAKTKYGINDEEILNAIWYHCTGRPQMSLFDKIIYVADYMEPNRDKAPNLANIRELAYVDLDACLVEILKQTLDYLNNGKITVDPMTAKTYDYYNNTQE